MLDQLVFVMHRGVGGMYCIKSEQVPGLMATGYTIPDTLVKGANAIRDLALAIAMSQAEGRPTKPMFVEKKS